MDEIKVVTTRYYRVRLCPYSSECRFRSFFFPPVNCHLDGRWSFSFGLLILSRSFRLKTVLSSIFVTIESHLC